MIKRIGEASAKEHWTGIDLLKFLCLIQYFIKSEKTKKLPEKR